MTRKPSIGRLERLADYIAANGPISLRRAMEALRMGNPSRTVVHFAPYAASRGITKDEKGLWSMNQTTTKRLTHIIIGQGPISEKELFLEAGISSKSRAATLKDLREWAALTGRVRFNTKTSMWEPAGSSVAESRTAPEFRPLKHDVYAHAWLRAGAMDYKTIRNPHMQA